MKNRNLKFLLLGMTIFSLSTQTFSQEYRENNEVMERSNLSAKEQITNLEKENTDLREQAKDHMALIKGKQNLNQSYRHRLTYETGEEREKTLKKQEATSAEIWKLVAERNAMFKTINKNDELIEALKKAPVAKPIEDKKIEKEPVVENRAEVIENKPAEESLAPAAIENSVVENREEISYEVSEYDNIDENLERDGVADINAKEIYIKNGVFDLLKSLADTDSLENLPVPKSLDEALNTLKTLKNNTPYTHSLKTGIESIQLFENNIVLKDKTSENQWNAKGGVLSSHSKDNTNITSNINGAIATVEYGVSENNSIGFALGGNHQSSSFKGDNSLKGTSMYVGTYFENDIKNIKTVTGMGYQLTDLKSERDKNSQKYKQGTYNIFTEFSYMMDFSNTLHIEPIMRLSYYNLSQHKIKENYKEKSVNMRVKKTTKKLGNLFIGTNLIKDTHFNSGKLSSILTLGVNNTLGDRALSATGNIVGKDTMGSNFKLENEKFSKINGVTGLSLEFQGNNNTTYSTGVNFLFGDNSNRALQFNVGVGYKF